MTKNDVTGRDNFVVLEALATALVALEQLPQDHQPQSDMDDMRHLLVSVLMAVAKSRLKTDDED